MERQNSKVEIMTESLRSILPKRYVNPKASVPLPSPGIYKPHKVESDLAAKNGEKENEKVCENSKSHNSEQNFNKNVDCGIKESENVPVVKKIQKKDSKKPRKVNKNKVQISENHIFLDDLSSEMFEIENIVRNPIYVKLIDDLVSCFTSNSTLSKSELANLKLALFERTSSVFVKLLNECIDKTFNKVLNSDIMQELKTKYASNQDASCQTRNFKDKDNEVQ